MTRKTNYACPRCDYPLVPVHAVEGKKRTVIALTCPEPYCDHMQMTPRRAGGAIDEDAYPAPFASNRLAERAMN